MRMLKRFGALGLLLGLTLFTLPLLAADEKKDAAEKKEVGKDSEIAVLIVHVPNEAEVFIEGKETSAAGTVRRFYSPKLPSGKKLYYTIVAKIEPNNYTKITRTRKVYVEPGKEYDVDMTKDTAPKEPDEIKIRYVPTPQEVVDAMLKLGGAKKDDVVYDLGCGDGRIVCTAVAKFGAKSGVGVDIDPERIEDCKKTAEKFKVGDKVRFSQEDVLKMKDISDASLVCLYMGNEMNLAMRPLLWKSLKPGSRVVSHRFIMGDWKPEKTETMEVEGVEYKLHLWTITDEVKKKAEALSGGKAEAPPIIKKEKTKKEEDLEGKEKR
jgi:uncharacterized protein (TIGR03000 family)